MKVHHIFLLFCLYEGRGGYMSLQTGAFVYFLYLDIIKPPFVNFNRDMLYSCNVASAGGSHT